MSFNSTMVRLKDVPSKGNPLSILCFNSTMVRLKASVAPTPSDCHISFNSTMVRLKEVHPSSGAAHGSGVSIPQWFD